MYRLKLNVKAVWNQVARDSFIRGDHAGKPFHRAVASRIAPCATAPEDAVVITIVAY